MPCDTELEFGEVLANRYRGTVRPRCTEKAVIEKKKNSATTETK